MNKLEFHTEIYRRLLPTTHVKTTAWSWLRQCTTNRSLSRRWIFRVSLHCVCGEVNVAVEQCLQDSSRWTMKCPWSFHATKILWSTSTEVWILRCLASNSVLLHCGRKLSNLHSIEVTVHVQLLRSCWPFASWALRFLCSNFYLVL